MSKELTKKQKCFADLYIINGGNATKAAIDAGYSKKSARVTGCENLTKPNICEYIQQRTKEIEEKAIVDLTEALRITSSIARGEIQEGRSKQVDNIGGEVIKDVSYFYTPTIEERQKSLEHIIKCNGGFTEKLDMTVDIPTIISGDDELED